MMNWSVLLVLQVVIADVTLSKVVSEPPARYVLQGVGYPVTLKCQYYKDGVFQYFISNALWFRNFTNGSSNPIGDTGPVSAYLQSLIFHSGVREVDQGNYSCCAPGGGCSELSLVAIAVSPVVKVDNTNYTAFIGSSITLACRIVYEGTPQASFQWRRHGLSVRDDHIVTNDTHTMLQLTNLTEEDHGMYRCVARWMLLTFDIHDVYLYTQVFPKIRIEGPSSALSGNIISITCSVLDGRPSPNIHIITPSGETITANMICFTATSNNSGNYTCVGSTAQATVTATYYLSVTDNMENESNLSESNTEKIQETFSFDFLVTLNTTEECNAVKNKGFAEQLTSSLKQYIDGIHDNETQVSVISTLFKCISNSTALYDVEIRGNMINNTYKYLEGVKSVELGNATLTFCIQPCNEEDHQQEADDESDGDTSNASVIIGLSVSGSLTVAVLICVAIIAVLICIRHRNKSRQKDAVRCTGPPIPSVTNTTAAITEANTGNKPMQNDIKIGIVITGEAKSPCTRDSNGKSQSFSYDDVLVSSSVDIANM